MSGPARVDIALEAIFEHLCRNGAWTRTQRELAETLGIAQWEVTQALFKCRSPEFIAEHGWFINNVRKGRAVGKVLDVVDCSDSARAGAEGVVIYLRETLTRDERSLAHNQKVRSLVHGNARLAKVLDFRQNSLVVARDALAMALDTDTAA